MFGDVLIGKQGEVNTAEALKDKVVGVYFSAQWYARRSEATSIAAQHDTLFISLSRAHTHVHNPCTLSLSWFVVASFYFIFVHFVVSVETTSNRRSFEPSAHLISLHRCPPCSRFTPKLAQIYKDLKVLYKEECPPPLLSTSTSTGIPCGIYMWIVFFFWLLFHQCVDEGFSTLQPSQCTLPSLHTSYKVPGTRYPVGFSCTSRSRLCFVLFSLILIFSVAANTHK